jgi:hypothetical protein
MEAMASTTDRERSGLGTFLPLGNEPLETTPTATRFTAKQRAVFDGEVFKRAHPDRSAYIRAAVLEKMQADGLLPTP